MKNESTIKAGNFTSWLEQTQRGEQADVPCGDCNACCRASYFIHVTKADGAARKAIPAPLLFPAPGQPEGCAVMGFNEAGTCPMLIEDRCSIYTRRPATCRDYDCRIFAATGISAGGAEKRDVTAQVQRWQFECSTPDDRKAQDGVKAAGHFLKTYRHLFKTRELPENPTELALLAIRVYEIFIDQHATEDVAQTITKIRKILSTAI